MAYLSLPGFERRGRDGYGDAEEDRIGDRVATSCERHSEIQSSPEEVKRIRMHDETGPTEDTANANSPTSSPPQDLPTTLRTGSKRPSTDLETADTTPRHLKSNSRAIYDANKPEINTWYDKDHTAKLGIPQHGKPKHSTAPWYQKLLAWQTAHGHMPTPPRKKRKLNNSSAQTVDITDPAVESRHLRPLPGDTVPVPSPPFTSLSDFETMPNGNYACGHVHRNPPLECCEKGLSVRGKREAIKKSREVWKKRVERLVDGGVLDPRHKGWEGWVCEGLREKYQPEVAERLRKSRERRARERRVGGRRLQRVEVDRSPASPASDYASPSPMDCHRLRSLPVFQVQNIPEDIEAIQTSFLANLARTDPRQLRQLDTLYRDAQYRESLKEAPDFALLKKWYLAYFLEEKRQPLSAEQLELLGEGDLSYAGRKRVGVGPALAAVDSLFGEYSSQTGSLPTLRTGSLTPAATSDFWVAPPASSAARVEPSKLKNPDINKNKLERVWVRVAHGDLVSQELSQTRSEASYLSTLPQSFATGNEIVDAEMRNMLLFAYQAVLPPQYSPVAGTASTSHG